MFKISRILKMLSRSMITNLVAVCQRKQETSKGEEPLAHALTEEKKKVSLLTLPLDVTPERRTLTMLHGIRAGRRFRPKHAQLIIHKEKDSKSKVDDVTPAPWCGRHHTHPHNLISRAGVRKP